MHTKTKYFWFAVLFVLTCIQTGCQPLRYWRNNDFKVGPNYCEPDTPVQTSWLDELQPEVETSQSLDGQWWSVFQDPTLDQLIQLCYRQNPNLKTAAARIAEARAQRNIAAANLFPQSQAASAQYAHTQNSLNADGVFPGFPVSIDDWQVGFDASWEVDLWGRIRRAIVAADASVDASIHDYDFLLVTLIGDVASSYIQIRAFDERIALAKKNIELQQGSLEIAEARFKAKKISALDVEQAKANLAQTKSFVPQLEQGRRQTRNALALLLGMTPDQIQPVLGVPGSIPTIPNEIYVGIPAELLRRRPDIRSSERVLAAVGEQIGIAEAELYPQFSVNGTFGYQAGKLSDLLESQSYTGTIAPAFRWQILNYGRLRNNVRVQEARFQQQLNQFENTVLAAQREVEDGIVEFLKTKEVYKHLRDSEKANLESVKLVQTLYREGSTDFGRVFVLESGLVTIQDSVVDSKAAVALSVIKTYKALGGGWQIRCEEVDGPMVAGSIAPAAEPSIENQPAPDSSRQKRDSGYRVSRRERISKASAANSGKPLTVYYAPSQTKPKKPR